MKLVLANAAPWWSSFSLLGGFQPRRFSRFLLQAICRIIRWSLQKSKTHKTLGRACIPRECLVATQICRTGFVEVCVPGRRLKWRGIRHQHKYLGREPTQNHMNENENRRDHKRGIRLLGHLAGSSQQPSQQAGTVRPLEVLSSRLENCDSTQLGLSWGLG